MKRTALVTGANRGIGFEACRQLGRQGCQIVLGSRDLAKGEAAASLLAGEGIDAVAVHLDVADGASVVELAAMSPEIDILVNNAGVHLDQGHGPLELDPAVIRATLDTNLIGAVRLAQTFIPGMVERGWGRVVNVSSGMGQLADMGGGALAYRLSKTALNALTRVLAAEVDGAKVKVNSACPGWVRTDMGGASAPRDVAQGAETIVWLANLPDSGPTGGFFRDKQPIPW